MLVMPSGPIIALSIFTATPFCLIPSTLETSIKQSNVSVGLADYSVKLPALKIFTSMVSLALFSLIQGQKCLFELKHYLTFECHYDKRNEPEFHGL